MGTNITLFFSAYIVEFKKENPISNFFIA